MAQNLAQKWASKVDEVFRLQALTNDAVNTDYDWDGVNSVNIYGVSTVTPGNYTRNGSNRYGTVNELDTTKTNYALSRDRAFTFTIDRRNRDESMGVTEAGKALRREIEVQVIPEIDVYRLAGWLTSATANSALVNTGPTTSSNAYSDFLSVNERMSNNSVPIAGRKVFMTYNYYNLLKQSNFILASDSGQTTRGSGLLGNIDGVEVTAVPTSYMPANTNLIMVHPISTVSPIVLTDYIVHENAPGVNGFLVEGRFVYDSFPLTNKLNAIAAHKTA
jgi:hypothetical protein